MESKKKTEKDYKMYSRESLIKLCLLKDNLISACEEFHKSMNEIHKIVKQK